MGLGMTNGPGKAGYYAKKAYDTAAAAMAAVEAAPTLVPATSSNNGYMTKEYAGKLDGIEAGANKYTHPGSGVTADTYQSVTVDAKGHVTAGTKSTTFMQTLNTQGTDAEAVRELLEMDYNGIVDAQIAKAEAHNNLFRGKEITESWASLKARIAQGDFSDIYIGDKKEITLTTGEKVVMEVAGIDTDYQFCDTPVGHHVDFISRDCLATTYKFNATNTNNGNATVKCPWLASALYTTLNSTIYNTLPSDLKSNIITKRALLEERYSAAGAVAADTSWSWQNMGYLWLPTEVGVFGHHTWSEPGYGTGTAGGNIQHPIFRLAPSHIIKGLGKGGSRYSWWEASARRTSATGICCVNAYGNANSYGASNALGVPLCFRIG